MGLVSVLTRGQTAPTATSDETLEISVADEELGLFRLGLSLPSRMEMTGKPNGDGARI